MRSFALSLRNRILIVLFSDLMHGAVVVHIGNIIEEGG